MKKACRREYREASEAAVLRDKRKKAYQSARNMYLRGFSVQDTAGILEEDEKTVSAWYERWGKQ